jgi:hypothetical protein
MISLPKLLLIAVVIVVVWYVLRVMNRPPAPAGQRQQTRPQGMRRQVQAEELVPCAGCGAYVATTARRCGRASCPLPH